MKLTIEPGAQFADGMDRLANHLNDSRLAAEDVQAEVARAGRRVEVALLVVAFAVLVLAMTFKANAEAVRCPTS